MTLLYNGLLIFLLSFLIPFSHGFLQGDKPVVISPKQGDVLQGTVAIAGSTNVVGFKSAEVSFSYDSGTAPNWFLITESDQVVDNNTLAEWDTSIITDGNYKLLLRVYVEDGKPVDTIVTGLRVRNYTTIETPTPSAVQVTPTEPEAQTGSTASLAKPTSANPAQVTATDMLASVGKGIGIGVLILLVVGVIFYLILKPRKTR